MTILRAETIELGGLAPEHACAGAARASGAIVILAKDRNGAMLTKAARVAIVGRGFGLAAAKTLAQANACITLIDRTNHHLFQPLLYQVATAAPAPDIA